MPCTAKLRSRQAHANNVRMRDLVRRRKHTKASSQSWPDVRSRCRNAQRRQPVQRWAQQSNLSAWARWVEGSKNCGMFFFLVLPVLCDFDHLSCTEQCYKLDDVPWIVPESLNGTTKGCVFRDHIPTLSVVHNKALASTFPPRSSLGTLSF